MGVILVLVVLFGGSWLYYSVKKQAKRNLFFSGQFERQKALTHRNLILTTTASMDAIQSSLAYHLPDDRSARAAFLGGAMRVRVENPHRIVYHHTSHITAGGNSDEFTASVSFSQVDTSRLRAVVSIDRWREKDGVTRRTGISAMENFINTVVAAFRAVDPAVQIGG
jgi:hypothetical protein